jgi:hypothetical protein
VNWVLYESNQNNTSITGPYPFIGPYIWATKHCAANLTYFIWMIDEVRVYNRNLSDWEIQRIYSTMK